MKNETRDDRLGRILREADPVQGDAELTAEESRAMRRAVLTAAPERRRFPLSPALAGAAMAAVAAIVAVIMLRPGMNSRATDGVPSGTSQTKAVSRVAEEKPAPPLRSGVPSATRQPLVPDGTTVGSPAASAPGGRTPRGKRADRIAVIGIPKNDEKLRTRQIQFATPGGTRVIWILTSDKAL